LPEIAAGISAKLSLTTPPRSPPPSVSPTHADKRRAAIFNDRAITLVQLGRLDEAVADESEAIRLRPGQADYYANRARMFQRLGRTDHANSDWQRARTLHASEGSTSPP
jgi:Flp pilus assembly protein TadD